MTTSILNFKSLFEALPGNFLILQPNPPFYTILAVSDELLRITNQRRENVVGKNLFELYPQNPDAILATVPASLSVSLQNAINYKKPDQMPVVGYDVPNANGVFEARYWSANTKPVLNENNEVLYLIHSTLDITHQLQAEQVLREGQARQAYLLELSDRLRQLVDPVEIQYQAACLLGKHLGANRVGYAEDQGDGETVVVTRNYTQGAASIEGRYHYNMYGAELLQAFKVGRTVVRPNIAKDPTLTREEKAAHAELGLGATVNKPLLKAGKLMAILFVHYKQAHPFSEQELILIEETTERIWSEVQRARAEAALRESEARFRLMVDAVPLSIWITDAEGRTEYLNKHWCDYCGVEFDFATASEIASRFLHPEDGPKVMATFSQAMERGTSWEVEQRNRSAKGEYRWFLNRANPYRDPKSGQITKWFGVGIDIHERKRVEEHRQQLTWELESTNRDLRAANGEIQASNAELALANKQLHHINADLDTFIYTASHDLKAPITNIEGLMQNLWRSLPSDVLAEERVKRIMMLMQESVARFKKTIGNLSEVVKLQKETGGEVSLVNLSQVVREVLLDLAAQAPFSKEQLEVELSSCLLIRFSEKNLRSVVYNLLSNAWKYRSPERNLQVRMSCKSIPNYHVLIVSDNGLGMESARMGQLFTMFKRFHDHVEGSGIGLYMVKRMVENGGGQIEVESRVGVGTSFRLYFPR